MARISSLAYLVLGVSDLNAWETFAVDVVGLQCWHRQPDALAFRLDQYEQRIVLEQDPRDDIRVAGWEFPSPAALETYVAGLRDRGIAVRDGGDALAASRRVEKVYVCDDPLGFCHEFCFGPVLAAAGQPFASKVVGPGGFVAGDLGVGHILVANKDNDAARQFYGQVLGLTVSDYIREQDPSGLLIDAVFFHTATGRHHSLATAQVPSPKALSHMMLQVRDMDDVGLAYDRCIAAGLPIAMTLGHHPNDKMFSFYVVTPSGFRLEFGHGGIVIDDDTWKIVRYGKLSDWGHHRQPAKAAAR